MNASPVPNSMTRQQGVALIVALILLMTLTMLAVVATRTTTLDLKITTNQTLAKRTFQSSEAGRTSIEETLEKHTFYRGWPVAIGGEVPASSGFTIPNDIKIETDVPLYITKSNDPWKDSGDPQMTFKVDSDTEDGDYLAPTDLRADIFIHRLGTVPAPGSDTSQVTGSDGLGAGAAGAGSQLFYRIISRATGAGGSQVTTEALYRYVVTN